MKCECSIRINNIEFRYGIENKTWELIQWRPAENKNGKEYCFVIAFYRRYKEDYRMETVGSRFHEALESDRDDTVMVSSFGMTLLSTLHRFEDDETY